MYKAILFDLDGTLLPISNDDFLKIYFSELIRNLASAGLEPDLALKAVWAGIHAMMSNDGTHTNAELFWEHFIRTVGVTDAAPYMALTASFYETDFNKIKQATSKNPLVTRALDLAAANGRKVVLATNPVFPRIAQVTRLDWIDVPEDRFDIITDYSSDCFCKPDPRYYLSICERIGAAPEECLMVGNDESDDMMGASRAGLDCFLVTDYCIASDKFQWTGESGSFADLVKKLEAI